MADGYVADGGNWKKVTEQFVAVDGVWKTAPNAFVADTGVYKSAFTSLPTSTLSLITDSYSPYSRVRYSYFVEGVWTKLEIFMVYYTGRRETLRSFGPSSGITTVSESSVLVGDRTPNEKYEVIIVHTDSIGKQTTIASKSVTCAAPPLPKNWRAKGPITHNSGGLEFDSSPDVWDWETVNNTTGATWLHGGDKPYIYYSGSLQPSTRYWFQTRSVVRSTKGAWSPQQYFDTTPAPYTKGLHDLPRANGINYQSGGTQTAGWDNSRAYWYHANGDAWGSTRGKQRVVFFYDQAHPKFVELKNAFANGATTLHTWLYVIRANVDAGNNGGVPPIVSLHNTAYPNPPSNLSGNLAGAALGKGSGEWVEVPAHWGQLVVTSPHPYTGFMLGDSDDKNHYMAITKDGVVGTIRFEIA